MRRMNLNSLDLLLTVKTLVWNVIVGLVLFVGLCLVVGTLRELRTKVTGWYHKLVGTRTPVARPTNDKVSSDGTAKFTMRHKLRDRIHKTIKAHGGIRGVRAKLGAMTTGQEAKSKGDEDELGSVEEERVMKTEKLNLDSNGIDNNKLETATTSTPANVVRLTPPNHLRAKTQPLFNVRRSATVLHERGKSITTIKKKPTVKRTSRRQHSKLGDQWNRIFNRDEDGEADHLSANSNEFDETMEEQPSKTIRKGGKRSFLDNTGRYEDDEDAERERVDLADEEGQFEEDQEDEDDDDDDDDEPTSVFNLLFYTVTIGVGLYIAVCSMFAVTCLPSIAKLESKGNLTTSLQKQVRNCLKQARGIRVHPECTKEYYYSWPPLEQGGRTVKTIQCVINTMIPMTFSAPSTTPGKKKSLAEFDLLDQVVRPGWVWIREKSAIHFTNLYTFLVALDFPKIIESVYIIIVKPYLIPIGPLLFLLLLLAIMFGPKKRHQHRKGASPKHGKTSPIEFRNDDDYPTNSEEEQDPENTMDGGMNKDEEQDDDEEEEDEEGNEHLEEEGGEEDDVLDWEHLSQDVSTDLILASSLIGNRKPYLMPRHGSFRSIPPEFHATAIPPHVRGIYPQSTRSNNSAPEPRQQRYSFDTEPNNVSISLQVKRYEAEVFRYEQMHEKTNLLLHQVAESLSVSLEDECMDPLKFVVDNMRKSLRAKRSHLLRT